jgi:ABC-2 type transport system permease protein
LAATPENIDYGSIIGSYAGLLFLASSITSIGMFASTLSNNQIVAFITGLALSFFMFYGFEAIDELVNSESYAIKNIGLYAHFINIGRGVIDTKDLLYFISVTFFFLFITKTNFDHKQ